MLLNLPRSISLNPSHKGMLVHPRVEDSLTGIRERVATTIPNAPEFHSKFLAEEAP